MKLTWNNVLMRVILSYGTCCKLTAGTKLGESGCEHRGGCERRVILNVGHLLDGLTGNSPQTVRNSNKNQPRGPETGDHRAMTACARACLAYTYVHGVVKYYVTYMYYKRSSSMVVGYMVVFAARKTCA